MGTTSNSGEKQNKQYIPREKLEVTFGVFFDGTLNNIKNIEARAIYEEYNQKYEQYIDENNINIKKKKEKKKKDSEISENVFDGDSEKKTAYEAYQKYQSKSPVDDEHCGDGYDYYTTPDDVSYENDYTNPARLFKCKQDNEYAIYIEGSGSKSYQKDNNDGSGYGYKKTGIRARVKEGCEELAKRIAEAYEKNRDISYISLTVDAYGFSRGAAAARNFIHEITRRDGIKKIASDEAIDRQKYYSWGINVKRHGFLGYYLNENGIDIEKNRLKITVRFAGLYDTVSSYGVKKFTWELIPLCSIPQVTPIVPFINMFNERHPLIPDFENDIKELELHKVSDRAKSILHLTASDEYRVNFALTKIKIKNENHVELSLPGSHADVGGSYLDNTDERKFVYEPTTDRYGIVGRYISNIHIRDRIEKYEEWGWFKKHERLIGYMRKKKDGSVSKRILFHKLFYKRKELSHKYSYIPLHLMVLYMEKFKVVSKEKFVIDKDFLEQNYSLATTPHFTTQEMCHMIKLNVETAINKVEKYFKDNKYSDFTITTGQAWKIYIEDDIKKILRGDFLTHYYITLEGPLDYFKKMIIEKHFKEGENIKYVFHTAEELLTSYINFKAFKDKKEEFVNILCYQFYIRWLRNRYLHHSADEHPYKPWLNFDIFKIHRGRYSNGEPNRQIHV
ncbi:MAG: DUF2235 domain-containing protein [Tannerellaceae bacterium]|nr:DUF2235 domain-containing protein [Tannerellaceae bacterium]